MKRLWSILFVSALIGIAFIFTAAKDSVQSSDTLEGITNDSELSKVEVYYFHGTRRCVTCKAVGSVSQDLIMSKYKEKVKFVEINIDEE